MEKKQSEPVMGGWVPASRCILGNFIIGGSSRVSSVLFSCVLYALLVCPCRHYEKNTWNIPQSNSLLPESQLHVQEYVVKFNIK